MPSLRCDFVHTRAAFRPENIDSGIHVPIMNRATMHTRPHSLIQTWETFRARYATASGAGLGRKSLGHLNVLNPVPHGFIAEHFLEGVPACIGNGLCQRHLFQGRGFDVAHDDFSVTLHKRRRLLVKVMLARVLNLGMDGLDAAAISGALRGRQLSCVACRMTGVLDLATVRQGCQGSQAKVYPHRARAGREHVLDFAKYVEIPAPSRILGERAALDGPFKGARFPQAKPALQVNSVFSVPYNRAPRVHGHPSERFAASPAGSPPMGVSAHGKLSADRSDCIAVQPKFAASPGGGVDQVNPRRPLLAPRLSVPLRLATVVPDEIDGPRVGLKMFRRRGVFNAVAIGKKHAENIAFWRIGVQS